MDNPPTIQVCGRCRIEKPTTDYSPSYRGRRGTWCRACFAAYNRDRNSLPARKSPPPQMCEWCGESSIPFYIREGTRFCSRSCKGKARNAATAAELVASKSARPCLHCGTIITPDRRSDASYCSVKCNDAAHAVTRKMAKRSGKRARSGELVSRFYIGDRDGWRCGVCGGKVARDRKHPDPLAPSVDHIVPLARGGTNDLANLQISHLRCNLGKRADAANDQTRLFG